MNIAFYKYEGTGNDFIMIDNRDTSFPKENNHLVHKLCDRHFGIGADGIILLETDVETDFKMVYYNADGNEGTMCGNGGRCIVAFANKLGVISNKTTFNAVDGIHHATIENKLVLLQMIDVKTVEIHNNYVFTNTGSPHHVQLVENLTDYDVVTNGKKIRNDYGKEGSNKTEGGKGTAKSDAQHEFGPRTKTLKFLKLLAGKEPVRGYNIRRPW